MRARAIGSCLSAAWIGLFVLELGLAGCGPTTGPKQAASTSTGTGTGTATGTTTQTTVLRTTDSGATSVSDASSGLVPVAASPTDAGSPDAGVIDAPEPSGDATAQPDGKADPVDAIVDTAPVVDTRQPVDNRPADLVPDAPVDTAAPVDTRPADVVNPNAGLLAYYPCESNANGLLFDQSSSNHSATLMPPVSFVTGVSGNALTLGKSQVTDGGTQRGYVALPANMFATAKDVTLAAWVRLKTNGAWNRVFDIGSSNSVYMFLTPNPNTSHLKFAITLGAGAGEQTIDGPSLELGKWTHLAIVMDTAGGHMFVDGEEVASNTSTMTLRPSDLGATPNSWLGRSEFPADNYFEGDMDEIRIYSRALSSSEIQALATP